MDPNATLKEMLELAKKLQDLDLGECRYDEKEVVDSAARLAELVLALDGWLARPPEGEDGFLPERWQSDPDSPEWAGAVREQLVRYRDECLGSKQPGFMDPDGAVILSHAIRWLSFKVDGKPYEPPTD